MPHPSRGNLFQIILQAQLVAGSFFNKKTPQKPTPPPHWVKTVDISSGVSWHPNSYRMLSCSSDTNKRRVKISFTKQHNERDTNQKKNTQRGERYWKYGSWDPIFKIREILIESGGKIFFGSWWFQTHLKFPKFSQDSGGFTNICFRKPSKPPPTMVIFACIHLAIGSFSRYTLCQTATIPCRKVTCSLRSCCFTLAGATSGEAPSWWLEIESSITPININDRK